ncbi:hypothetical protein H6F73_05245 [Microcoleus sp. FACHB-68]|nr:hypothetical protein [Microcoleus sp. FACHB-68]
MIGPRRDNDHPNTPLCILREGPNYHAGTIIPITRLFRKNTDIELDSIVDIWQYELLFLGCDD